MPHSRVATDFAVSHGPTAILMPSLQRQNKKVDLDKKLAALQAREVAAREAIEAESAGREPTVRVSLNWEVDWCIV